MQLRLEPREGSKFTDAVLVTAIAMAVEVAGAALEGCSYALARERQSSTGPCSRL